MKSIKSIAINSHDRRRLVLANFNWLCTSSTTSMAQSTAKAQRKSLATKFPHDVNDSVDTMWEYPGISHVRSFKNLPPYPGFVLMIIVFQKESLVPPKWWPGWLASNLRSSALRAALWAWRSNAKWGTSSARSQSGLGSSAGNFGGARWDKLQLSARNLKFQHVSTFEYLSVLTMSFFHHSFKSLEQTYVLYELLALPEPFLKQQHSLLPMTAKDGKFPTTKHPKWLCKINS